MYFPHFLDGYSDCSFFAFPSSYYRFTRFAVSLPAHQSSGELSEFLHALTQPHRLDRSLAYGRLYAQKTALLSSRFIVFHLLSYNASRLF